MLRRLGGGGFLWVAASLGTSLWAQSGAGSPTPAEVLKTVDRLIEQNRQLEKQNQGLMQEIQTLRDLLAQTFAPSQTPPQTAGAPASRNNPLLPEATEGNSAIFGEFNPGKGFTVAKSKTGELNLSGYMATR